MQEIQLNRLSQKESRNVIIALNDSRDEGFPKTSVAYHTVDHQYKDSVERANELLEKKSELNIQGSSNSGQKKLSVKTSTANLLKPVIASARIKTGLSPYERKLSV